MSDHVPFSIGAALTKEDALVSTARFTATHAGLYPDQTESATWLVTGAVLMAQQAGALALTAAGELIPAQTGATELVLRAASQKRLPPPYTLPLTLSARAEFDRLVEARNAFMHPRGESWHVMPNVLARGLPVSVRIVRHLVLTQPVIPDLIARADEAVLDDYLNQIVSLAEFLET